MSIPDKSRSSLMPMIMPPPGKKMLPTRAQATALEEALLGGLDPTSSTTSPRCCSR